MRNKDINEWLLDKGIDTDTTIIADGKEWFLSDILEMHLQEQCTIPSVRCSFYGFAKQYVVIKDKKGNEQKFNNEQLNEIK